MQSKFLKKNSEGVLFGEAAGFPPATVLKNEYIRRSFSRFYFLLKKYLF